MIKLKGRGGVRLDKFLADNVENFSRSKLQKLIKDGAVRVNGDDVKAKFVLSEGDRVEIEANVESLVDIVPEDLNLVVMHETDDYMVVNKPAGMVVHPSGSDNRTGTVVNAVMGKVKVSEFEDEMRPGIVHRLDKETSGLMVIAKNKKAYDYFIELFKERRIVKKYLTLVRGILDFKEGVIDSPIARDGVSRKRMAVMTNGKIAITKYQVLEEFRLGKGVDLSLLDISLETGRTHQIRVHMAAVGCPVVGDNVYGMSSFNRKFEGEYGLKRQFLHAAELEFVDLDGKEIKIKSPLPEDLDLILNELRSF
ncbi:RNA pseudouridine synthase [Candidatus Peregrinibacteria bacterium CG10_big_fil_rev_8_21_14_0_10_36_19]|nr:MAG: RNA pseudouridine synthase [Candidatus Peregrinibacteria bacterium CG10_big_fil_rev_8_21_14_0_10_36_19]